MKRLSKNTRHISAGLIMSVVAIASAIPPCDYDIETFGGTPCNELTSPPPPFAIQVAECVYFYCDESQSGCGIDPWYKKQRSRDIYYLQGHDPDYFSSAPSDASVGCCYCED